MEAGVKSKICLLICFTYFFLVQSITLQKEKEGVHDEDKVLKDTLQDSVRFTVKRSIDWSNRLHPSSDIEGSVHVADESENIEVTSKAPRIIRKYRIQHGKPQNMETLRGINPESRLSEGGTKIVRIKKFKRKPPIKTTFAPESTSREFTTTPSPADSMLTSSSPYSHITVINKEVRNPKKKKNKRKRLNNRYVQTPAYDSEPKQNGLVYGTAFSDARQISQQNAKTFSAPDPYSEYGNFYNERKQPAINERQNEFTLMGEHFGANHGSLGMNDNNYGFQPRRAIMSQHLSSFKDIDQSSYKGNSMIIPKQSAPKPSFGIYVVDKSSNSSNGSLKNVSSQVRTPQNSSGIPSSIDDKTKAQVTVQKAGNSSVTVPAVSDENSVLSKMNTGKSNASVASGPEIEPVIYPGNAAAPQEDRNFRHDQYRFPSRYPSLFYNSKDSFTDPFFDTLKTPLAMQRSRQDMANEGISPLHLPFSPFYASNNPQSEGYGLESGISPYHSEDLILPGFQHSPELRSLRRSIMDTYGDDTTTSQPVTHFTLPKFEMPPIDFNDKGCQTVYKEVKTLPSDGSESRNNNAKSFVMTRECYFPDGLPTTERTKEAETSITPITEKISNRQSKDMKIDSKESQ